GNPSEMHFIPGKQLISLGRNDPVRYQEPKYSSGSQKQPDSKDIGWKHARDCRGFEEHFRSCRFRSGEASQTPDIGNQGHCRQPKGDSCAPCRWFRSKSVFEEETRGSDCSNTAPLSTEW